jgi:plastocyanin
VIGRGVIALALILVSFGCSSPQKEASSAPPPKAPPTAPGRAVVSGKGPAGSVVELEPLFEHPPVSTTEPAYMDQSGQMFIPGLLTARTGQEVRFISSEDVIHNIRVDLGGAKEPIFNIATPPFGKYVHTFDKPGFYNVSCDIHTVMRATIFLSDARYVTQVYETGEFSFRDVVPGAYKVTAFVQGKPIDKKIDVSAPETTFDVP